MKLRCHIVFLYQQCILLLAVGPKTHAYARGELPGNSKLPYPSKTSYLAFEAAFESDIFHEDFEVSAAHC
jgi:hypothetical protein